jgi:GT2 family glycosyltransferase
VSRRPIHIVIPFYRNAVFAASVLRSLGVCGTELRELKCTVIAVNDSPEDTALDAVLRDELGALREVIPCSLIRNEQNLGFLKSANRGFNAAITSQADCILLNSDTVVFPGALAEMQNAAYSHTLTGFVSPRSNNATICSLPHQDRDKDVPFEQAYASFGALAKRLPAIQFVPTVVGFCMYVKFKVLRSAGTFDEVYGRGYNEENDLVMRGHRAGYCAAIANHAFVYHRGSSSFGDPAAHEAKNAKILDARYPEYRRAVNLYFASARYESELLLAALIPKRERPRICLAGISGHADQASPQQELLNNLRRSFEVFTEDAGARSQPDNDLEAAAVILVNPDLEGMKRAASMAPVNVYVIVDSKWFDSFDHRLESERAWRFIQRADALCLQEPTGALIENGLRMEPPAGMWRTEDVAQAVDAGIKEATACRIRHRLSEIRGINEAEASLQNDLQAQELELVHLRKTNAIQAQRIHDLENSYSWKLTLPMRRARNLLRGSHRLPDRD